MDAWLENLNGEQRQAVLHDHEYGGPLLVLAGAGSGKTSVLTRRIQHRIASGLDPARLLALTFTAKAAAEMEERVHQLFPGAGVRLCTFHSLGLYLLRAQVGGKANWERLGFACAPMPSEQPLAQWLDALAELGITKKPLDRGLLFSPKMRLQTRLLDSLRSSVLSSGKVVFEDLIWLSISLLTRWPEVREWAHGCWQEILVDEYQDIDPAQYELVKELLGHRRALFVVGDDDQAIYGFRGADIGNICRFQADFPCCRLIRLEWNYRSTPSVLSLANRIFSSKPLELRKTLRPAASRPYALFAENRWPEVWNSHTPLEEAEKLVHGLRSLREEYGLAWSDFAILVRYNRQRLYYRRLLEEWGIPLAPEETLEDSAPGGVQVETVHASKGLQYPVVFYAGLAEGLTPGETTGRRRQRKAQLEEEKRLFYVGVTRAEALLVFLYCRRRHWRGSLRLFSPSPFLRYAAQYTSPGLFPMPVLLFRALAALRILWFLASVMPSYLWARLRGESQAKAWIEDKAQDWCRLCLRAMGMEFSLQGQELLAKVDWTRPVIVVSNHESYADIPVVLLAVGRVLGFLAKKELKIIPFLNYWMGQIGCLFVDRRKKGSGGEVRAQIYGAGEGTRIVIFPEGTRSRNGALGTFKSGAFRLACELEATLLPIVHSGTRGGWEDRKNARDLQAVRARILPPMDIRALKAELGREISPKGDVMPSIRSSMEEARKALAV